MTFEKLHKDLDENCKCILKARSVKRVIFTRRLKIRELERNYVDLRPNTQKQFSGKNSFSTCEDLCRNIGVSVDEYSSGEYIRIKKKYIKDYNSAIRNNPSMINRLSTSLAMFELEENAGLYEKTTKDKDSHRTFYASDEYSNDLIKSFVVESFENE